MFKQVAYPYDGYKVNMVTGEIIGKQGRVLVGEIDKDGYQKVLTYDHSGGRRKPFVHQLVAQAAYGPPPEGLVVNHKNGIKRDNRPENLEYISASDNLRHAYRNNFYKNASPVVCRMRKEDFFKMLSLYSLGYGYPYIAKKLDMKCRPDYVGEILNGSKGSELTGFSRDKFRDIQINIPYAKKGEAFSLFSGGYSQRSVCKLTGLSQKSILMLRREYDAQEKASN